MTDFDFAAVAVVPDSTRTYRIDALGVTLTVAPAGEENRPYWSAVLVAAQSAQPRARKLNPDTMAEARDEDVVLFAAHVLKGWEGVKRSDGTPFPFTGDNAREWLTALARHAPRLWYAVRDFAKDADNFTAGALGRGISGNS